MPMYRSSRGHDIWIAALAAQIRSVEVRRRARELLELADALQRPHGPETATAAPAPPAPQITLRSTCIRPRGTCDQGRGAAEARGRIRRG